MNICRIYGKDLYLWMTEHDQWAMCGVFSSPPTQSKAGRWFRLLTGSHQVTRPRKKEKQPSGYKTRKKEKVWRITLNIRCRSLFQSIASWRQATLFHYSSSWFCLWITTITSANEDQQFNLRVCLFWPCLFPVMWITSNISCITARSANEDQRLTLRVCLFTPCPNTSFVNHLKHQLPHCQKCKWNAV